MCVFIGKTNRKSTFCKIQLILFSFFIIFLIHLGPHVAPFWHLLEPLGALFGIILELLRPILPTQDGTRRTLEHPLGSLGATLWSPKPIFGIYWVHLVHSWVNCELSWRHLGIILRSPGVNKASFWGRIDPLVHAISLKAYTVRTRVQGMCGMTVPFETYCKQLHFLSFRSSIYKRTLGGVRR